MTWKGEVPAKNAYTVNSLQCTHTHRYIVHSALIQTNTNLLFPLFTTCWCKPLIFQTQISFIVSFVKVLRDCAQSLSLLIEYYNHIFYINFLRKNIFYIYFVRKNIFILTFLGKNLSYYLSQEKYILYLFCFILILLQEKYLSYSFCQEKYLLYQFCQEKCLLY